MHHSAQTILPLGTGMKVGYSVIGNGNFCLQSLTLLIDQERSLSCIYTKDPQVIQFSRDHAIPCFQDYKAYISYLKSLRHRLCILLLNPTVFLPKAFFEMDYLRVHCQNSLLPNYPFDYAPSLVILNHDKEAGISWHTSQGSLHKGNLLIKERYDVTGKDTPLTLSFKAFEAAIDSFLKVIRLIESNEISTNQYELQEKIPQPYLEQGIVNFECSSVEIINLFKACDYGKYRNPFHVPKIIINGCFYVVEYAEIYKSASTVPPGRMIDANDTHLQVSTKDNDIRLSALYDMDQTKWSPKELCDHYNIRRNDPLTNISVSEKKIALDKVAKVRAFENEAFIRSLEQKKPLDLEFLVSKRIPDNKRSYHSTQIRLSKHRPEIPSSDFFQYLLSLLHIYLYRLNNFENFSLDITNEKTVRFIEGIDHNIIKGIPFGYALNPEMRVKEVIDLVKEEVVESFLGVNKDIFFRVPELNSQTITPLLVFIGQDKELALRHLDQPLILTIDPRTYEFSLHWCTHRFQSSKETFALKSFLSRFASFVESITSLEQKIGQLTLLTAQEYQVMVDEWNQTVKEYPRDKSFMELFRSTVKSYPDRIAVKCKERHLTYTQLLQQIESIGNNLFLQNVKQQDVVAVFMTRDIDYWLVLLGIWHINAVYVPIDPGLPANRIATILLDSKATLVVSDQKFYERALKNCGQYVPVAKVDELLILNSGLKGSATAHPRDLAYIIYTSGSTGNPKGAMIEHAGMLNHLYAKINDLTFSTTDTIAQIATQSFDISIWQFITPLLVGGTSSIFVGQDACEPELLVDMVEQQLPQIVELVPSHMMVILDELELNGRENSFRSVRWLFLTGEGLNQHICKRWFELYPEAKIMNGYGATETSDDATHFIITKEKYALYPEIMPVSGTIMNSQLYVLDKLMNPLPVGCKGEIFIGGNGVGRGYLNDSMKTSAVFLPDPFHPDSGTRIYKTGDIGVFQYDGVLDYLGRKDNQVKLRGHRIEIGEIEGALLKFEEIAQAAAIIREDLVGQKRLIAYLVLYGNKTEQTHLIELLKQRLSAVLPEYMVPNDFVFMKQLPLLDSGKLDKKSLPKPSHDHIRTNAYHPPENPLEHYLVGLWSDILRIDKIGVSDHFFKIGGHSLNGMKIMAQIRKKYKIDIPSSSLFQYPTIRELSDQISNYNISM